MLPSYVGLQVIPSASVSGPPVDPHWADVLLLLHGNGADGSTTFTDSSSYNRALTIFDGTPEIDTSQSLFGGASLYGGTGNTRIRWSISGPEWNAPNWTFECFYRRMANAGSPDGILYYRTGLGLIVRNSPYDFALTDTFSVRADTATQTPLGAWCHLAVSVQTVGITRTAYLFIDGHLEDTFFVLNNSLELTSSATPAEIGRTSDIGFAQLYAHLEEVRITAACRYTSDFEIPTEAYPDGGAPVAPPAPPPSTTPPEIPSRLGVSEVRYIETSLGSAISPAIDLATLTGAVAGDVVVLGAPVPGCTIALVGSPPTALQLSGTPTEAGSTRVTATYTDSSGQALGSSAHVVNVLDPAALFLVGTQAAFSGRVGQPADVTLCSPSVATNAAVTASFNMNVGGLVPVLEWTPGATSTGVLKIVGTPTRAITGIETLVVTYRSGTRILGTSSHSVMCSRAYEPPPPAPAPSPAPPPPPAPAPAPAPAPTPAPPPGPPADTLLADVLMLHRFDSGARSRFVSSTSAPPAALFEGLIGPSLSGSAELDTGVVGSAAFFSGGPGVAAPYQATWAAAPESACVQALTRVDEDTGLWLPGPGERFCPIVSCISPSGQTVWSLGLGSFLQYRSPSEPSVRTVVAVFFRSKMSAGGYVAATARLNMQSSTPSPGNWAHLCGQWYTNHTACWWGARGGLDNLGSAVTTPDATVPAGSFIQVGGVVSGVRVDGKPAACLPLRGAVDELRFSGRLRYSVGATVSTKTDQIPAASLQLPWPNY